MTTTAEQPATSTIPAQPAPLVEARQCRKCGETKAVKPETWVYRPDKKKVYHAHGTLCLACEKQRKSEYETRRGTIVRQLDGEPKAEPKEERQALKVASKLDVARALKAGSQVLNDLAPSVLARIAEHIEDPESEHHMWALELVAQRILPRKLYEELGGEAAGVGALHDKRPQFIVNILPAQPGAAAGNVVEGEVTDVQILPASPEP